MIASPYLGGNGEREAVHPVRCTDSEGEELSGVHRYVVMLPSAPSVDAFRSLTMYNADDKMLAANEIDRFKVGSDTPGLAVAADGSITIPTQTTRPVGEAAANWLPAPEGSFYVILRLYQPSQGILDGEWPLPELVRVP